MDMTNDKISEFLAKLGSSEPYPGGGGASALAGALAAELGCMVGTLTVGKKKYADVEEDIKAMTAEMKEISGRLADCIGKDAEMFAPLAKAYSIPKDEPGRDETLEKCLRDAAATPFEIMELCCKAVELLEGFAAKGSKMVLSDAATGAALCRGALLAAAVNVKVNTRLMKDRVYADDTDAKADAIIKEYVARADKVFSDYYNK